MLCTTCIVSLSAMNKRKWVDQNVTWTWIQSDKTKSEAVYRKGGGWYEYQAQVWDKQWLLYPHPTCSGSDDIATDKIEKCCLQWYVRLLLCAHEFDAHDVPDLSWRAGYVHWFSHYVVSVHGEEMIVQSWVIIKSMEAVDIWSQILHTCAHRMYKSTHHST